MLNHTGTTEITTERLILRRFKHTDKDDVFNNWANDENVTKYLAWTAHSDTEVTEQILKSWIDSYEDMAFYQWAIVPKEYGKAIGSISVISVSNNHKKCEIGYCSGAEFWGKGFMSESLQGILKHLFGKVGFKRIQAIHDVDNPASGKVMIKAGMKQEGILRNYLTNNQGNHVNCSIYSILKEDVAL